MSRKRKAVVISVTPKTGVTDTQIQESINNAIEAVDKTTCVDYIDTVEETFLPYSGKLLNTGVEDIDNLLVGKYNNSVEVSKIVGGH